MLVADRTDTSEIHELEKHLQDMADQLGALVPDYGKAKQVIEFASDQRKRALAKSQVPYLEAGDSASSAEAKARASFVYGEELASLAAQLKAAETVKAKWDSLRILWESARSLLSAQKEMSRL